MRTLTIVCVKHSALHRVDVEAIEEREVNGVRCFMHIEDQQYIVSSLECGGKIADGDSIELAWIIAGIRLRDQEIWGAKLKAARDCVLEEIGIYPVNPVEI